MEKFSRWLRAICTIILARNTPADRVKAIGYVEQAVNVMEEHNDGDEVSFLLFFTLYPRVSLLMPDGLIGLASCAVIHRFTPWMRDSGCLGRLTILGLNA